MQVQLSQKKKNKQKKPKKLWEQFESSLNLAWIVMLYQLNIFGKLIGHCIWKSKNDFG